MHNYGERTLTLVRGEGNYVWDDRGHRYLDAISGIAVCGLGHCHPKVTEALQEQANTLLHVSNLYNIPPQQQLADRLVFLSGMDNVFFSNSGAEANEAAIKLARKLGNERGLAAPQIVVMEGAFHGRTLATLTATGNEKVQQGFAPYPRAFCGCHSMMSKPLNIWRNSTAISSPSWWNQSKGKAAFEYPIWIIYINCVHSAIGRTGY